jgi:hypothetical protein
MTWTFFYLMLLLKLPVAGMLWLVWWMIHQKSDDPQATRSDDGGAKSRKDRHPRPPRPPRPRRGPHTHAATPPSPARVRSVVARARRAAHE